jgi:membrane associated rhomboid family serine protease
VNTCPTVGEDWPLTAFTSMFMHGSWSHLLGNMLFLWIFGNNVEDALGKLRFLVFYLLGGLAATAVQTVVTLVFATDAEAAIPNVGASGAVSAVLGAYFVLLPTAKVLTVIVFILRDVPAVLFLGIWFGFQLLDGSASLLSPQAGGGIAFFAHIGGFVFGMLLVKPFQQRRPLAPTY